MIDSIDDIFYYKVQFHCYSGSDELSDTLPSYQGFRPSQFNVTEDATRIIEFINQDSTEDIRINIAHNMDSIVDYRYFDLKRRLLEDIIAVSTRLITEEEDHIVYSILNNKEYNPKLINWKSTIYFPDSFNEDNVP